MKTRNVIGSFRSVSIVTVKQSFIVSQIVSCQVDHTQPTHEMTHSFILSLLMKRPLGSNLSQAYRSRKPLI